MPLAAAVVAAPIQKLWLLYRLGSIPTEVRAVFKWWTKLERVRGEWSAWRNSGPSLPPLAARYCVIRWTGHILACEQPMYRNTPWRNGSVLLCLMWMQMSEGAEQLSMAMSLKDRWAEGSNSEAEGAVNSADLRNPKKARQQAAFNMAESGLVVESQTLNNLLRWAG